MLQIGFAALEANLHTSSKRISLIFDTMAGLNHRQVIKSELCRLIPLIKIAAKLELRIESCCGTPHAWDALTDKNLRGSSSVNAVPIQHHIPADVVFSNRSLSQAKEIFDVLGVTQFFRSHCSSRSSVPLNKDTNENEM